MLNQSKRYNEILILLNLIGEEILEEYTFKYDSREDNNKLETIIGKFEAYCQTMRNIIFEKKGYTFFNVSQKEDF